MSWRSCVSIAPSSVSGIAEGRVDQGVEHVRRLRDRVGEARRGAEEIGEEQAQAVVRLQDGQELHGGRHAPEGAVEGGERPVRIGRAAERRKQGRHELGQDLARAGARDRGPAAEMPAAHGLGRLARGAGSRGGAGSRASPDRRSCR